MIASICNLSTVMVVCEFAERDLSYITTPLQDTANWSRTTPQEAIGQLERAERLPEIVVLVQDRPGEISNEIVARMQAVAPLTAFYVVTGSWCEGETRTGQPWPGVLRCDWHEWPLRWRDEMRRQERGELQLSRLPVTASDEERLLAQLPFKVNVAKEMQSKECVVVLGDVEESRSALADALRAEGYITVACRSNALLNARDVAVVVWDTPMQAVTPASIARIKARFQQAPLLVITTFPRQHVTEALTVAGGDAILGKPFLLVDLYAELRRIHSANGVKSLVKDAVNGELLWQVH